MPGYVRYRKQLQSLAKRIITGTQFPPSIEAAKFMSEHMNCYAFALNLPLEDPEQEFFIPGCISDYHMESEIWNTGTIVKRIIKDLHCLGLRYREVNQNSNGKVDLEDGEYAIAIYGEISTFHDCTFDFHIIRSDSYGLWQAKNGRKLGFKVYSRVPDLTEYNMKLLGILAIRKK